MYKSHKYDTKQKWDTKDYILYDSIYIKLIIGRFIDVKNRDNDYLWEGGTKWGVWDASNAFLIQALDILHENSMSCTLIIHAHSVGLLSFNN